MGTDPLPLDEAAARALVRRNHSNAHHRAAQKRAAQCLDARITSRCVPGKDASSGVRSRCASFPCAKTWPRRSPGARPYRRARRSSKCHQACLVVVDAMGVTDAGIFGDILCARMKKRGVAALITDGTVRDVAGVLGTDLPVWCSGVAAPPSVAGLTFVGWQQPIGCGGVAVFPNDVVVADDDGAVLIPAALLDEVIAAAVEQERLEGWIMGQVEAGQALPGLYPPNEANKAAYQAWASKQR